jgi:hypothetical protein
MEASEIEASGEELWRLVRPTVKARGPLKVLRRMGPDGYLHDRIAQVVQQWGAKRVLLRLRVEAKAMDMADAAWEALADLAAPGKRLHLSTREANRVALDLLDACADLAEDNPGATVAGSVIEAIGTELASVSSAYVLQAWRVGDRLFVTGDDVGAVAVFKSLNEILAWWLRDLNWPDMEITCSGLKASLIEALGLVRGEDDDWVDGSVCVNGRMWRRQQRERRAVKRPRAGTRTR